MSAAGAARRRSARRKPGAASSASAAAATGQADDEPGGEARLGGRRAGVALEPVARLERGGELAQQRGEVAAGVALEQDRGDERVPGARRRAGAEPLEHRLGRLAERERARRDPQLVPGRARQRRRDLVERAAHRVPGGERVGERPRGAGRARGRTSSR